jgi:hypothetical protein
MKELKEASNATQQHDIFQDDRRLSSPQGERVTAALHCHPMIRHRKLSMALVDNWQEVIYCFPSITPRI